MSYEKNKRDSNEKSIIEVLCRAGYWEQIRSGTHDGNWHARGYTFNVEIKNGDLPPSKRPLTEREQNFKRALELCGVRLWILLTTDDAWHLVRSEYDQIEELPEYA